VVGAEAIAVGRWPLGAGAWFPAHRHPQHQLSWASRGAIGVVVGARHFVLPPTRALWIPAGTTHLTGATRDAELHSLYVPPDRPDIGRGGPVPVAVDGLLVALAAHLARPDLAPAARRRAEGVVMDGLRPLPDAPIDLPDPADDRARAVAAALHADPADPRGLGAHAAAAGTSRRTLSRLFVRDTGLTFEAWRTRLRLRAGLILLADGAPVSRAAHAVGYATPSAFLAAFRRVTGTTPGRYLGAGEPIRSDSDTMIPSGPRT
jgi:AraC-like DNA-binding protein